MKKKISRQSFLQSVAILSGGVSFGIGSMPGKAYAQIPSALAGEAEPGKVLVIIQLGGGNDGLNTVIPGEDDKYYTARPNIAIPKASALKLDQDMYLHPSMVGIKKLYDAGQVAIAQNIGYPNPNRSHFRATDIWNTGSASNVVLEEGWAGRYLLTQYPNFPIQMPKHPMAVQLGSVESLAFQSDVGRFGTVFEDPNLFYQLVSGSTADMDAPPKTQAGEELGFLNQVAAASIQFATVIQSSAAKGKNSLTYPSTGLGRQLGIVSKLVSGGLATPIYLVNIGGFDTHSNQLTQHANLWRTISEAVSAFQTDLKNQNLADRVSVMTFSEFGRRINQNGSLGTDHGTAAPMFVIGKTVRGGIVGANPDLKSVDASGDLKFKYDYRQVYSTVLRDHLGLDNVRAAEIFQSTFERLPLYNNSIEGMPEQHTMELLVPWPNPIRQTALIQYGIFVETDILLAVYDIQGRLILNLFEGKRAVGSYSVTLEGSLLASGHYILSLQNLRGGRITRSIQIQND